MSKGFLAKADSFYRTYAIVYLSGQLEGSFALEHGLN